jgi:hypothetical protein
MMPRIMQGERELTDETATIRLYLDVVVRIRTFSSGPRPRS